MASELWTNNQADILLYVCKQMNIPSFKTKDMLT